MLGLFAKKMIIAVDDAIPYWDQAFLPLGEVRPFHGRNLRPSDLRDADALIVRTVTKVDASLLEGTSVQFVGSATIGMDHVDTSYLERQGIRFSNAAGCNANAVADYVTAALLVMANRLGWELRGKSIAIIGVGNVGSRVEKRARALGMEVFLCDPPLRDQTGDERYLSLDEVLNADILTFHVPLTWDGPYPTYHMVDRSVLDSLTAHPLVINTARGSVIVGSDLKSALSENRLAGAVLDVWEDEPGIDLSLLEFVDIGTSHIAGYSVDGKVRAAEMIFDSLCRHFHISASWDTSGLYPQAATIRPQAGLHGQDALCSIALEAYPILRDDEQLRKLLEMPAETAREAFDALRNQYPLRPEFRHFVVDLPAGQPGLAEIAGDLGFKASDPAAGRPAG